MASSKIGGDLEKVKSSLLKLLKPNQDGLVVTSFAK
jgi:hypothetical protein